MAIKLPHIEDSLLTNYIPPKGEFNRFQDDEHYENMVRLWELSTTKVVKKEFWYKGDTYQRLVKIIGYETYGVTGEFHTLIIEFQDGHLSCIHPPHLKEMQAAGFGKESSETEEEIVAKAKESKTTSATKVAEPKVKEKTENQKTSPKPKKEKKPALELPVDKVHFGAKVKQFALMWNNFNEQNEEVVVLEELVIQEETTTPIGLSWCSHSKTLKKLELQVGDILSFDGKIVKKTLAKGKDVEEEAFTVNEKVLYKINNPSKLKKN